MTDDRCPTCRQRNSRVREHLMEDGSVVLWYCNVPGCSNHAGYPNGSIGEGDECEGGDEQLNEK
jgi:hypothetical protein